MYYIVHEKIYLWIKNKFINLHQLYYHIKTRLLKRIETVGTYDTTISLSLASNGHAGSSRHAWTFSCRANPTSLSLFLHHFVLISAVSHLDLSNTTSVLSVYHPITLLLVPSHFVPLSFTIGFGLPPVARILSFSIIRLR